MTRQEEIEKLLARPEWIEEQREFLSKPENFALAIASEKYLSFLDKKISFWEGQKQLHRQKHPIFYFFKDLIDNLTK